MTAEDDDPGIDATDLAIAEMLADAELLPYSTGNGYEQMQRCPRQGCGSGWHFREHAHMRQEPTPIRPTVVERIDGSVDLGSITTDPPPPLLIDRLDPTGSTILYGTGGVGKGVLASAWIVLLVRAGRRVLILDYEGHPEEWSRRIFGLDPDVHASGAVRHFRPSQPIALATGDIRAACDANDLDYVVVDSAVMACGADPLKPEAAAAYDKATLEIARPMLTLAHVTKVDDGRFPFGSVFWHNLARLTWSMSAEGEDVRLQHRKRNNYESRGSFTVQTKWTAEGHLAEVLQVPYSQSILERVLAELPEGGLTMDEILVEINGSDHRPVTKETLKTTLHRANGKQLLNVNGRWQRG